MLLRRRRKCVRINIDDGLVSKSHFSLSKHVCVKPQRGTVPRTRHTKDRTSKKPRRIPLLHTPFPILSFSLFAASDEPRQRCVIRFLPPFHSFLLCVTSILPVEYGARRRDRRLLPRPPLPLSACSRAKGTFNQSNISPSSQSNNHPPSSSPPPWTS